MRRRSTSSHPDGVTVRIAAVTTRGRRLETVRAYLTGTPRVKPAPLATLRLTPVASR